MGKRRYKGTHTATRKAEADGTYTYLYIRDKTIKIFHIYFVFRASYTIFA